jgi:hypothetical protein
VGLFGSQPGVCARRATADLSSIAKALCTASIAASLMFTTVCCASAQSSGDSARGSRSKGVSSPNTPDIWDANHDGVYTCDEWKSYLERLFNFADRNRDGHLDQNEFATVRKMAPMFADADFGYFDENQDGKITHSEFVNKPSEFIIQNDKNGDCRVTPDELKNTGNDQKSPGGRGKRN